MSGGMITDTESVKLSNANSYHYKSGEKSHKALIKKIAPIQNASRASRHESRADSVQSFPKIKNPVQNDQMPYNLQSGSKIAEVRRAVPSVINHLLL